MNNYTNRQIANVPPDQDPNMREVVSMSVADYAALVNIGPAAVQKRLRLDQEIQGVVLRDRSGDRGRWCLYVARDYVDRMQAVGRG